MKNILTRKGACSNYYAMEADPAFGKYLRECRLRKADAAFSVRKLAGRVGIEPSYLSKIERGEQPPPGEGTIRKLAMELGEDSDVLLALAGKVPTDLLEIVRARPRLFADLLRELKSMPDSAVLRIVREVRDGDW